MFSSTHHQIHDYRAMRESIIHTYTTRVHNEPSANLCERGEKGSAFRCVTSDMREGILVIGTEKKCYIFTEANYGDTTLVALTVKTDDFGRNLPFDVVLLDPTILVKDIESKNLLNDPEAMFEYVSGIHASNNKPYDTPVVLKYMYSENTPA